MLICFRPEISTSAHDGRKIEQQHSIEDLSNDINQSWEQFVINSGDTVRTFDALFSSGDNLGSMPMVIIMHGLGGSTTDMQGFSRNCMMMWLLLVILLN